MMLLIITTMTKKIHIDDGDGDDNIVDRDESATNMKLIPKMSSSLDTLMALCP